VFAFGNTAYLALDTTVVTNGSSLTFFSGTASQGYQSLGTAVLRNNPLVVAIPLANTTLGGLSFTVTAATASGPLNTFAPPPVAVQLVGGQGGEITFRLPRTTGFAFFRVRADVAEPLPASFYAGPNSFDPQPVSAFGNLWRGGMGWPNSSGLQLFSPTAGPSL